MISQRAQDQETLAFETFHDCCGMNDYTRHCGMGGLRGP